MHTVRCRGARRGLHGFFPQSAVSFLPVYHGELVSLLKITSIVGYISIPDLTKMSDITRVRRRMGMVFQSFNLFNNLTVIENIIAAPVKLLKVPRNQAYREGMELLQWVGLAEKEKVYPDKLSGGQKLL